MMLYLSDYIPTEWERGDECFVMIIKSCKCMVDWMEKFISIKFYDFYDYRDFLNNDIFHLIPELP